MPSKSVCLGVRCTWTERTAHDETKPGLDSCGPRACRGSRGLAHLLRDQRAPSDGPEYRVLDEGPSLERAERALGESLSSIHSNAEFVVCGVPPLLSFPLPVTGALTDPITVHQRPSRTGFRNLSGAEPQGSHGSSQAPDDQGSGGSGRRFHADGVACPEQPSRRRPRDLRARSADHRRHRLRAEPASRAASRRAAVGRWVSSPMASSISARPES